MRVVRAPCMGRCDTAPVAEVGHHHVDNASVETVMATANAGHVHPEIPDYEVFDAYMDGGGYRLLRACLEGSKEFLGSFSSINNMITINLASPAQPSQRLRVVEPVAQSTLDHNRN